MKPKNRRKKFPVINPPLQYRLLVLVLAYGLLTVIFIAVFFFLPDALKVANEKLSLEVRAAAADRILIMHSRLWPSLIALISIIAIHSFRVFLKIVGPLYRLRLSFSRIAQGDLSFRVRLRAKDYLTPEAEIFNKMIDALSEKWNEIQSGSRNALESLSLLEQSVSKTVGEEDSLRQLFKKHHEQLKTLEACSGYFKLIAEDKEKSQTEESK